MRGSSARAALRWISAGSISPDSRAAGIRDRKPGRVRRSWGSFKDIFSGIFTGAQQQQQRPRGPQPGTDLEYQATIDFWSAIRGGQARLQVHRQETCPTCHGMAQTGGSMPCPECNGTGQVTQMGGRMKFNIACPRCGGTGRVTSDCPTCHGEGTVSRTETVEFRIKPGTRDGQRIRLQGKGNAGVNGGAPGDLYVIVRTGTNPVFTRAGDDIQLTVPVTIAEASLGAKVEVPDDRWTRAVEDSAGDAERAEAAHARTRRGERVASRDSAATRS